MQDFHSETLSGPARAALVGALRSGAAIPDLQAQELAAAGWRLTEGALAADAGLLFGVDVGGTKTQSVLTDLAGRVLAETKEPTVSAGGDAVLGQIRAQRDRLLAELGQPLPLLAAGIGLPGAVHPATGVIHRMPNVAGLAGRDLRALLAEDLGLPVAIENDANLAALGEGWLGHGRGHETFVFVAMGTGIGMGSVVNGALLRGAQGAAGEIAALPIGADPFDPATFAEGALETAISSRALLADYLRRGGTGGGSLRELFLAEAPDPAFEATLERLAILLAQALLATVSVLDPSLVILGGSIGSRPEVLERTRHHLSRCLPEPPECRISSLGNRAGVIGAARAAQGALIDRLSAG